MGRKTPKIASSPWDFVTLPEDEKATDIGNMHKNLVKIVRVALEISWLGDRQTDVLITFTILRHSTYGRPQRRNHSRKI